jgi:hypothetical protein
MRFGSFFESSPRVYLALVDDPAHNCNKVDTALQNFRNAQATEDVEAFHAISSDIVEMIRELEDFSLLHRFSPPLIIRIFIFLRLSSLWILAPAALTTGSVYSRNKGLLTSPLNGHGFSCQI